MRNKLILILAVLLMASSFAYANQKEVDIDANAQVEEEAEDLPVAVVPQNIKAPGTPKIAKIVPQTQSESEENDRLATKEQPKEALPPETVADDESDGQLAFPELTMRAKMSSSDVNRIVCKQDIKDVIFSKEKDISVKYSGKNAFVKFKVARQGQEFKYASAPVELFVICGDNTFNLIGIPRKVPSQTIRLDSGKAEKIAKNNSVFQGQALEKRVVSLIKMALTDSIPDSFAVELNNKPINAFAEVGAVLSKTISVEGEGLILKEFILKPKLDIQLAEKRFLVKEFAERPLGVAIDKLKIKGGDSARLFIVEAKEDFTGGIR